MHRFLKFSFVCVFSMVMIVGCGSGPDIGSVVAENNKSNVQKVSNALGLYQIRIGKAAKTEEELVDFIATNSTIEKNLNFMKIDRAFKDHLTSERDGEPFFVRYGVYVPDRTPAQPLVFEALGVDGSRQVGWSDSSVTDVSDNKEYDKLKSGKVKKVKPVDAAAEASKAAAKAAKEAAK